MKSSHPTIGGLLRSLRARNKWTLKQMSERSGIPLSTLSKIEHDRLSLTYDRLQQLSERLNIRMSELFAESEDASVPAVTARRSIGRVSDAVRIDSKNYEYFYLCPELRRKRMVPSVANLRARSLEEFGPFLRHAGEEFIYVLKGTVVLHTEFYDPLTLEEGESVYIDSNMGHAYVIGPDSDAATVMAVAATDDDQSVIEALMATND
ncbi:MULTISPECIES: XRE family transcriptional regulator [unclassified Lysobacter]|uniref:helix-turn-helix domain-containing protein n=1 Tax=unclassified Lysobacter TaxID=2635362 RepID=UPI0006FFBE9B|nr:MULTISPECIES: XRE family transcriptional regulator [unclassified Lysobacter]KRA17286.1 XRE family transcriptional regulator [Lysobacter sp. Root604]KRD31247.1 XRE family transcriptional regulator [Lysobacter sp. Root916]KRD76967.1 XRE family transcriptional regulator [Lysobacter sp. Root983]